MLRAIWGYEIEMDAEVKILNFLCSAQMLERFFLIEMLRAAIGDKFAISLMYLAQ